MPNSVVSTQASVACNVDNVVNMLSLEDQFCVSNRVSFSDRVHLKSAYFIKIENLLLKVL